MPPNTPKKIEAPPMQNFENDYSLRNAREKAMMNSRDRMIAEIARAEGVLIFMRWAHEEDTQ